MVDKSIDKTRSTGLQSLTDLKSIFEAINIAPNFLSKRFIMTELLGWSDELVAKNAKLKQEEIDAERNGNKVGSFR